jgi:threonine/homoserine/homoserine lactone efflux protein
MDTIIPFLAYAGALALAVAIPGPGIAALIGQSLGAGFRGALPFIAGIALGDIVYLTAAVAGLAALAKTFGGAMLVVKSIGGLYLAYLAYRFWTGNAGLTRVAALTRRDGARAMVAGFGVTLGNPKPIVFYMALVPTVIDLRSVGVAQWAILVVVTAAILFIVLLPYAALASKARLLLTQPDAMENLNKVASIVIGCTGAFVLGQVVWALSV